MSMNMLNTEGVINKTTMLESLKDYVSYENWMLIDIALKNCTFAFSEYEAVVDKALKDATTKYVKEYKA